MHADELVWAVENLANSDRQVRTSATDKCLRFQTANGFDTGVCVKLMRADMGINIRAFAYESLAVVIEKLWRSLRPQVQSEIIQLYPFHDAGDRDNLSLRPFLARVLGIFFAYVAEPSAIENFFGNWQPELNELIGAIFTHFIIVLFSEQFPADRTQEIAQFVFRNLARYFKAIVLNPLCQEFGANCYLEYAKEIHEWAPAVVNIMAEDPEADDLYCRLADHVWQPSNDDSGGVVSIFETVFSVNGTVILPQTFQKVVENAAECVPSMYMRLLSWQPIHNEAEAIEGFLLMENLKVRLPLLFMVISRVELLGVAKCMDIIASLFMSSAPSIVFEVASSFRDLLKDQEFIGSCPEQFLDIFHPHLIEIFKRCVILHSAVFTEFPCSLFDEAWIASELKQTFIECAITIANLYPIEIVYGSLESILCHGVDVPEFVGLVRVITHVVDSHRGQLNDVHELALRTIHVFLSDINRFVMETQMKMIQLMKSLIHLCKWNETNAAETLHTMLDLIFKTPLHNIDPFMNLFDTFVQETGTLLKDAVNTLVTDESIANHPKYKYIVKLRTKFEVQDQRPSVEFQGFGAQIKPLRRFVIWDDSPFAKKKFRGAMMGFSFVETLPSLTGNQERLANDVAQLMIQASNRIIRETSDPNKTYTSQMIDLCQKASKAYVNFTHANPQAISAQLDNLVIPKSVTLLERFWLESIVIPMMTELAKQDPGQADRHSQRIITTIVQEADAVKQSDEETTRLLVKIRVQMIRLSACTTYQFASALIRDGLQVWSPTGPLGPYGPALVELVSEKGFELFKEIFVFLIGKACNPEVVERIIDMIYTQDATIAANPAILNELPSVSNQAVQMFIQKSRGINGPKKRRVLYRDFLLRVFKSWS